MFYVTATEAQHITSSYHHKTIPMSRETQLTTSRVATGMKPRSLQLNWRSLRPSKFPMSTRPRERSTLGRTCKSHCHRFFTHIKSMDTLLVSLVASAHGVYTVVMWQMCRGNASAQVILLCHKQQHISRTSGRSSVY